MKTSLKALIAVTASVMSTGAIAASNLENPLYMPKANEAYVKLGAAMMAKKVESTQATRAKGTDGSLEIPVWRFTGDLGYGITDRFDIHGRFGYTNDVKINRKGMHRGRVGMMFRALTEDYPLVWDLYADLYLSGVSEMKGTLKVFSGGPGFDYENYSNGRYGAIFGTRLGKTLGAFTLAGHVEYLQTFGNHNNKIAVSPAAKAALSIPVDELSVDLKSTHEWTAGFDTFYQMSKRWSLGLGFEYVQHANNGVDRVYTRIPAALEDALVSKYSNMEDGWDE